MIKDITLTQINQHMQSIRQKHGDSSYLKLFGDQSGLILSPNNKELACFHTQTEMIDALERLNPKKVHFIVEVNDPSPGPNATTDDISYALLTSGYTDVKVIKKEC